MSKKRFYITTPIYYPNANLHIGHAYTTVFCDAVARWHRFEGKDVFYLTGSDEHGQKIERTATSKGQTPLAYVDGIVESFKDLWERLDVAYDDFIRTTEPRHERVVQAIFQHLYDQGDIYKDTYEGWYCTPCESFWPESRLLEGNLCPECERPVELVKEESYFFRISKYADRLLKHIEEHPEFIQPETRRNEMVSFIKQGLEELCVSRTTFEWGIHVPFDKKHVVYVWIDALANYLTGVGYLQDDQEFEKWWPADVHVVGKDILRFHTIIWPCILMAVGLPLPKQVYGHGWIMVDSGKMSKSKGTVIDPIALIDEFGVDAIRYSLLREMPYGQDAKYSRRGLVERINSDLANDLGNALHRSLAMLNRYFEGVIPTPGEPDERDRTVIDLAEATARLVAEHVEKLEVNLALVEIWKLVGRLNKYIDETEPWTLARDPEKRERLATVMYTVLEGLRIVTLLITPFLPRTGEKMWAQLGITDPLAEQHVDQLAWGGLVAGTQTHAGDPVFPRIDVKKALAEEEESMEETQEVKSTVAAPGAPSAPGAPKVKAVKEDGAKSDSGNEDGAGLISIDDFAKVQLRVAKVVAAGTVKGADKLLKLQVDVGESQRQIVAGIAQHYQPDELVGKTIIVVANLKPAKLRGETSEGMLLAASDEHGLSLVTVEGERAPGAQVR